MGNIFSIKVSNLRISGAFQKWYQVSGIRLQASGIMQSVNLASG